MTSPTLEQPATGFDVNVMDTLAKEANAAVAYARQNRGGAQQGRVGGNFPARHLCYWRLCTRPNCHISGHAMRRGWITVGPSPITRSGEAEVAQFERAKHATLLKTYGDWSTYENDDNFTSMIFTTYDPRFPFGQFETLMTLPGGVREFPVSQIRALRWHHNEFIQQVRPDACSEDFPCKFDVTHGPYPKLEELHRHVSIMHQDQASVMALGEQINRPIDALIAQLSSQQDRPDQSGVTSQTIAVLSALAERLGIGALPSAEVIYSPDGASYWDTTARTWLPVTVDPAPSFEIVDEDEPQGFIPLK